MQSQYWTPVKAAQIKAAPLPGIVTIWTLTSDDFDLFKKTPPKAPKKAPKPISTLNPSAKVFVPSTHF